MGIFDFFKKKNELKEIKVENIDYDNLESVLSKKEKGIESIKKEVISSIIEKKSLFLSELNAKLRVLEKVTLDNVKEHPKIKHLVLFNRDLYIKDIRRLLSTLESLENLSFADFKDKIEKNFIDFKKNSEIKYQKATHLIGKEMAAVNETITLFFKEYHKIIEANSHLLSESEIINSAKKDIDIISENEQYIKEFKQKISIIEKEVKENKTNANQLENEIDSIKKSEEYISNLENIKKEKLLSGQIETELVSLKQLIDFKTLSKTFHGSKKYEQLVNDFREDFSRNYKSDNGAKLLELLGDAKISNSNLSSKVEDINKSIQNLGEIRSSIIEDKAKILEDELKHINSKIIHLNEDKERESKLLQKIKGEKSNIFSKLKEDLQKIDINLND